ncbi:MAG: effector binding domain-containing protein [Verrucomicrobia bacterium]|nr:effector binding domain-containing protein [Verrucomicrobiota bacterium]
MELNNFFVVGIAVRTTNENGQSGADIPQLWGRFFQENILAKIPNKIDSTIYSVYTDYEGDFMKPYTTLLGCKVPDLKNIPQGLVGKEIPGGKFLEFTAKGRMQVLPEWINIWKTPLPRRYTADFEVYRESVLLSDGDVPIFIAVSS